MLSCDVLCYPVYSGLVLPSALSYFMLSRGFGGKKDVYDIMHSCPLPAKLALSAKLIDGNLSDSVCVRLGRSSVALYQVGFIEYQYLVRTIPIRRRCSPL